MLDQQFCFLDVETTGINFATDKVIEVGVVKAKGKKIIETYSTLVNPERRISPFINKLTGISQRDLLKAPTFAQIKDELYKFIGDDVLVAHNAGFDYGFISSEFERFDMEFLNPYLCSVRMSRALFPEHSHHSLGSLIKRFGIEVDARHRALEDARVIFKFFQVLRGYFKKAQLEEVMELLLHKPAALPEADKFKDVPKTAGVYVFYDKKDNPLYIGKSINLKNRIKSHFGKGASYFADKVERIETIPTAGELGALIRESVMIKQSLPIYNVLLRDNRTFLILKRNINEQGYIVLEPSEINEIDTADFDNFFGIFKSKKHLQNLLVMLSKSHNLCYKLLGLEKGKGPCFSYQLGHCSGACVAKDSPGEYNSRLVKAFDDYRVVTWPYQGAVKITESVDDQTESFVFDNWCLVSSSSGDLQKNKTALFDMDIYKILRGYLKHSNKFQLQELGRL